MDLWTLLPLLKGWIYHNDSVTANTVLAAGDSKTLFETGEKKGYVISSFLSLDNPLASIEIIEDGYKTEITYFTTNLIGLVQPAMQGSQSGYIAKYDLANSIFTGVWAPALPTPFARLVRFTIKSPVASATTILAFFISWIEIVDETAFRRSLTEILKV